MVHAILSDGTMHLETVVLKYWLSDRVNFTVKIEGCKLGKENNKVDQTS
jgi:hypothetical protein